MEEPTNLKVAKMNKKMNLKSMSGSEPHKDWGGWHNFLKTCDLVECYVESVAKKAQIYFYRKTNCNYVVLPNGKIIENYGYHGKALISRIKRLGWEKVYQENLRFYEEVSKLLGRSNG